MGLINTVLLYGKVARVQTLMMSIFPCLLSYLYCNHKYNNLNTKAFIFTSISVVFFHLAVNTISEYRDCIKGIDDPTSPGTKYRLVSGIVSKGSVLYLGVTSFIIASVSGLFALYTSSLLLLIPGLIGACIALFYSEQPFGIKYKALGEIAVFVAYGPLLGFSTTYSLVYHCSIIDLSIFIPGALLITDVLLANNIRDYRFDLHKTKTLVTILGMKKSYILLYLLAHLSYIVYFVLIYTNIFSNMGYWLFITYPSLLLSHKFKNNPKFINYFGSLFFIMEIIVCISLYKN